MKSSSQLIITGIITKNRRIGSDKADAPQAIALDMFYSVWETDTVKVFGLIINLRVIPQRAGRRAKLTVCT